MKMVILVTYMTLLLGISALANEHSLGAHEHGSIKVGISIDKNAVEINIDGPAESFLGFEYVPKTVKEKKLFSDLEMMWTKKLDSLIAFEKNLNCKLTEASFKQIVDQKETAEAKLKNKEAGVHSDIEAVAKLTCDKNLNGSEVTISLRKTFKKIKKLIVEILGDEVKSVEIVKDVQVFKI